MRKRSMRLVVLVVATLLLCSVLLATSALGHLGEIPEEESQNSVHIDGWDLTLIASTPIVGKEANFTLDVVDSEGHRVGGLEMQGTIFIKDDEDLAFASGVTERRPGQYTFTWTPSFAGPYNVQFLARGPNGEELTPAFPIKVVDRRANYALGAGAFIGALVIALGVHFAVPHHKRKKFRLKPLLYGVVGGLAIFGLSYSVATFYLGGGERGFVVCGDTGCDIAIHWHSQLEMNVCGQTFNLPLEKGDLDKQHTHKERDLLHFHALIKSDTSGTMLEPEKLRLGQLFDALNIRFTKECFSEHCNGDACPDGHKGDLHVLVNDIENTDGPDYNWKDGDVIRITFN